MSGHTPETWENPRFTAAPYSIWCGNTQIATTRWTQDDGSVSPECVQDDNEAKANARLIAAAPLQHAELIACKQFLEDMHTQTPEWTIAESQKRHEAVCAAIAEATGETP